MKKTAPAIAQRPRGRPPMARHEIEKEKQRIGFVARRLFQQSGFEAISLRRLATEAGVTTKTLYAYFADKREILQHIWLEFFEELFEKIDEIAASGAPRPEALHTAALYYVNYWVEHPERYRLVFMASDVSQKDVGDFLGLSNVIQRYAVFADLLGNTSPPRTSETVKLNALICALNGISHNIVTINNYSWGDPKDLLDLLLASITAPATEQ